MESVWNELRKIESEAERIHLEAENKSKEILRTAKEEGEKLLQDAEAYSNEEASRILEKLSLQGKKERDRILQENEKGIERLRKMASANMDEAAGAIFEALLRPNKP